MAEKTEKPGKTARPGAAQRSSSNISWGVLIVGIAVVILLFALQETTWGLVTFGIVLVLTVIELLTNRTETQPQENRSTLITNHPTVKPTQQKANSAKSTPTLHEEETVGELLNSLDEGFDLVNNIHTPAGKIEHLVLSRENGVFVINVCDQIGKIDLSAGTLKVNGEGLNDDPILKVIDDTAWVRQKIRETTGIVAWVKPVIVFTHAHVEEGMPLKGVTLIQKGHLLRLLYRTNTPINRMSMLWENREKLFSVLRSE
jgi:hypothetical protein